MTSKLATVVLVAGTLALAPAAGFAADAKDSASGTSSKTYSTLSVTGWLVWTVFTSNAVRFSAAGGSATADTTRSTY